MKTREGFVSNSSSSSFIVVGAYIDYPSGDTWKDLVDKAREGESPLDFMTAYDSSEGVLGKYVTSLERYCTEEIDLDEIQTKIVEVKRIFKEMGLDPHLVGVYNVGCEG